MKTLRKPAQVCPAKAIGEVPTLQCLAAAINRLKTKEKKRPILRELMLRTHGYGVKVDNGRVFIWGKDKGIA